MTVEMAAEHQMESDGAVCAGETLSPVCEWMNVGRTLRCPFIIKMPELHVNS